MTPSGVEVADGDLPALLDFDCPRCGQPVSLRFYGPCEPCRLALRAALAGTARDVEVAAYEPKANVVANQIATKE
jgi:hypothetical protein